MPRAGSPSRLERPEMAARAADRLLAGRRAAGAPQAIGSHRVYGVSGATRPHRHRESTGPPGRLFGFFGSDTRAGTTPLGRLPPKRPIFRRTDEGARFGQSPHPDGPAPRHRRRACRCEHRDPSRCRDARPGTPPARSNRCSVPRRRAQALIPDQKTGEPAPTATGLATGPDPPSRRRTSCPGCPRPVKIGG